jgi:Phytanoyl-CoA dioxygenase (PhyH)
MLTAQGHPLDTSPQAFGQLRRSGDAVGDVAELHRRIAADGYLFLPGYLDRDEVLAARRDVLTRLVAMDVLSTGPDLDAVTPGPGLSGAPLSDVARDSEQLMRLLYNGRMIELYERLFDQTVRHFDFTWLRAVAPGTGTAPHSDSVFMNRGTPNLLTAWVPLGDIDRQLGGVAILEQSHLREDVKRDYGSRDVDTYCSNRDTAGVEAVQEQMVWNGWISDDPVQLRTQLGLRWLTTDYRAGDLLTFPMHTLHLGLDNASDRVRLSSDSRYQPATEPVDDRWVGANPSAHGSRSKRGMIC